MANVDLSFLGTPGWAAFIDEAERQEHVRLGLGYYWKDYVASLPAAPPQPGLPPPPEPPKTQVPGLPDADDTSAKATIMATLGAYGLGSLGDWAWRQHQEGVPIEQIYLNMRDTPEYKQRFPAMSTLAQRGQAMSEADYINYENGAKNLFKAAGLPQGFYDSPDDFDQFLMNDIALPELESRVDMARTAVYNSDVGTLQALESFYNVGGRPQSLVGDLTAFFLDETRAMPLIQQQFIAARTSGSAARAGYGPLTRTEAERLAMLGVDPEKSVEGFSTLDRLGELFVDLPGELAGGAASRAQGLAAMFESNADAQSALERVAARRRSQFGQGGGYSETGRGLGGIG